MGTMEGTNVPSPLESLKNQEIFLEFLYLLKDTYFLMEIKGLVMYPKG